MCYIVVSLYPFLIVLINLKIKIFDEVVDDCIAALRFIPPWFFRSKMLEKLHNALHANDDILL